MELEIDKQGRIIVRYQEYGKDVQSTFQTTAPNVRGLVFCNPEQFTTFVLGLQKLYSQQLERRT